MAGEDEKSRYYIDPDSGMLIAGGDGGLNSQGEGEWTPEQLQAWEGGDASSYESSAGGHDTNASTTSSYAALGNAFGKSTWNASTTAEEEDWTGIVLEPVNEYDDYAHQMYQSHVAVYPEVQTSVTGQRFQFLGKCQNMNSWDGWERSKTKRPEPKSKPSDSNKAARVQAFVPSSSMEFNSQGS